MNVLLCFCLHGVQSKCGKDLCIKMGLLHRCKHKIKLFYRIDATHSTYEFSKTINHSRNLNIKAKLITVDDKPRLYFVATRDIAKGEEILYDYMERRAEIIKQYPWLKS